MIKVGSYAEMAL